MINLLIILMYSYIAGAEVVGSIICSEPAIKYGYINGINNPTYWEAQRSSLMLTSRLKIGDVHVFYNKSNGIRKDLSDSLYQKIEELKGSWFGASIIAKVFIKTIPHRDNRKEIVSTIEKEIEQNSRLVVFSHSQGNLYANIACELLKEDQLSFSNIQIGTPASKILCGKSNHYTTIRSDEMYQIVASLTSYRGEKIDASNNPYINKLLNTAIAPVVKNLALISPLSPPLRANIDQPKANVKFSDFYHHSMDNYLSYEPSLNQIKAHHREVVKPFTVSNQELFSGGGFAVNCRNAANHVGETFHSGAVAKINGKKNPQTMINFFKEYTVEEIANEDDRAPASVGSKPSGYRLVESFTAAFYCMFLILGVGWRFFLFLFKAIFLAAGRAIVNSSNQDDEDNLSTRI